MAFKDTFFLLNDNTGAKLVKCIYVYDKKDIEPASVILVTLKKVLPGRKVKKGQLYKAVVVRLNKKIVRSSGLVVKYFNNCVILLKKTELVPLGTRIFGSVYLELRLKGFMKVVSLSLFLV
jgi:large subunit ribosomal protein L14